MTDRRSILRAALAAPALAASTVAAASPRPNNTLTALWDRWNDLLGYHAQAEAAFDAAMDRFEAIKPTRPEEAYAPDAFRGRPIKGWPAERQPDGSLLYFGTAAIWREVVSLTKTPERRAFAEARLAAVEAYEEQCKTAREAAGVPAASRVFDEADDKLAEVEDAILDAPATSIRDLAIKAAVVRRQDWNDFEENGSRAAKALIADIERMALSV
ncbi:MAG: hypothetical protein K0S56_934 [Microvirga sp.]|jgi:hypothetical protein|nr:hypothetical protein [Microvirga sp.]